MSMTDIQTQRPSIDDRTSIFDENNSDEEDDNFDNDGSSILAEAIASKQSVQICRKNAPHRKAGRMSLMAFFQGPGGDELDESEADIVTADVASLEERRRAAKATREQLLKDGSTKRESGGRGRRRPTRASTLNERQGQVALRRMSTFDTAAAHKTRALSPTRMSMMPASAAAAANAHRPLARSQTTTTGGPSFASTFNPTAAFDMSSPRNSDASASSRYAEHEETIKRLTVGTDEIAQILEDPQAFAKLQKVLRKHGAVTNEVLRQVLPLYVKHQITAKEAKLRQQQQQAEAQAQQQVAAAAAGSP